MMMQITRAEIIMGDCSYINLSDCLPASSIKSGCQPLHALELTITSARAVEEAQILLQRSIA